MLNWVKNSVGITDSNHGAAALHSVADQAKETPYTELTTDHLKWQVLDSTNVETKTFYMCSDDGHVGLCQVIYSNVLGVRTTAQFSSKIFSKESGKEHRWSSDNLSQFQFSPTKQSFHSRDCSMELSEDGKSYHIKSSVNKSSLVDLKFTQSAPGFVAGKDGTSYFGTDPKHPWGKMSHAFWPWCTVEGNIETPEGPVDFKGRGIFIHALMGMKPHFAAAKWNFVNFQSPSYSAIFMNYTTPSSYDNTPVSVGGIVKKSEIVIAGTNPDLDFKHVETSADSDNNWPEPHVVNFTWRGKTADGKDAKAVLEGNLGKRVDRVDVMGEMPKFVKQIVAGASGTKPYIYQYVPKMKIQVDVGGEVVEEEGQLFMEATFIS